MDFEYGCAITNKYGFLNENDDVEDPSELLAQVSAGKEAPAPAKKAAPGAKTAGGKPGEVKAKPGVKTADPKKPLQQTDNSVKSGRPQSQQNKTGWLIRQVGVLWGLE